MRLGRLEETQVCWKSEDHMVGMLEFEVTISSSLPFLYIESSISLEERVPSVIHHIFAYTAICACAITPFLDCAL